MNPSWIRWLAVPPACLLAATVGLFVSTLAFDPWYPHHYNEFPYSLCALAFALASYHFFSRLARLKTGGALRGLIAVGATMGIGQVLAFFLYIGGEASLFHGIEFIFIFYWTLGFSPLIYALAALTQGWPWENQDIVPILVLSLLVPVYASHRFKKDYQASYEKAVQRTPNKSPADLTPQQTIGEGFLGSRPLGTLPYPAVLSLLDILPEPGQEILAASGRSLVAYSGKNLVPLANYSTRNHDTKEYWYNAGTILINDENGNPPLTPTPAPTATPVPDIHDRNYSYDCVGLLPGGKDPWVLVVVKEKGKRILWSVGGGPNRYNVDGDRRVRLTSSPECLETVQAVDLDGDGTYEVAYTGGPYSEDFLDPNGNYSRSVSFEGRVSLGLVSRKGETLFTRKWPGGPCRIALLPAAGGRKGLILVDVFEQPMMVLDARGNLVKEFACPECRPVVPFVWEGRTCLAYVRVDEKDSNEKLYAQDLATDQVLFSVGLFTRPATLKIFPLKDGAREVLAVSAEQGQEGSFLHILDGKGAILYRKPNQGQLIGKRQEGKVEELLFLEGNQVTARHLATIPAATPSPGP